MPKVEGAAQEAAAGVLHTIRVELTTRHILTKIRGSYLYRQPITITVTLTILQLMFRRTTRRFMTPLASIMFSLQFFYLLE